MSDEDWDEPDDAPNLRAMVNESIARGMRQAAGGEVVRRDDWLASSLTEFLLARIAEDEAAVEARGSWWPDSKMDGETVWAWRPMDERDRREATAKRAIVTLCGAANAAVECEIILSLMTLPYAHHPDYRDEWA